MTHRSLVHMTESKVAWQSAYHWLCQQRRYAPANSEVWHLRFHWQRDSSVLLRSVEQGHYQLSPMRVIHRKNAEPLAMWCAQDALVLKWVALRVAPYLPAHDLCHHLKGRGCHHSLRLVNAALCDGLYRFVYRSDIRGYYQNICKETLARLVRQWVPDPVLYNLMIQFIYYSVEHGGEFHTPSKGISRGCALSPLLGGSLLYHVDEWFASRKNVFYVRYMDDFLLLTETRWGLRHAIRALHQFMHPEGFAMHPDKTQIGRLANGFDWVGIWFSPTARTLAPRALENHRKQRLRLYEQARGRGLSESAAKARVQAYVIRWEIWAKHRVGVATTTVES